MSLSAGGITIAPVAEAIKKCEVRREDRVEVSLVPVSRDVCYYQKSRYSRPQTVNETICYDVSPKESRFWPYPGTTEPKCYTEINDSEVP